MTIDPPVGGLSVNDLVKKIFSFLHNNSLQGSLFRVLRFINLLKQLQNLNRPAMSIILINFVAL